MSGRSIAMEVRWGWGAASLCGAMWVLLVVEVICVGAAVAPVLKAGETPVSALEAVSVSSLKSVDCVTKIADEDERVRWSG